MLLITRTVSGLVLMFVFACGFSYCGFMLCLIVLCLGVDLSDRLGLKFWVVGIVGFF